MLEHEWHNPGEHQMKQNYNIGRSQINMMLGGTGEPDTIVWVYTHPGDAGLGRFAELMGQVLADADAEQRPLVIRIVPEVAPGRTVNEARLREKLAGWGFGQHEHDTKTMVRQPDPEKADPRRVRTPEPEPEAAPAVAEEPQEQPNDDAPAAEEAAEAAPRRKTRKK